MLLKPDRCRECSRNSHPFILEIMKSVLTQHISCIIKALRSGPPYFGDFVCLFCFVLFFVCSLWLFHPFSVRREKFLTPRDRLFMLLFYLDNKSNLAYEYTNWKVRGVREMRYPFVFTQVQSATSLPVLLASFCLFFALFPGFFFLRPPFPSLLPLSLPHPSPSQLPSPTCLFLWIGRLCWFHTWCWYLV